MKRVLAALILLTLAAPALALDLGDRVSPRLERALTDPSAPLRQADGTWSIWVHFTDKAIPAAERNAALAEAKAALSPRALARRAKVFAPGAPLADALDLPIASRYIEAVLGTGAQPRQQSRWLNAASFDASPAQIAAIAQLPFVRDVDLVAKFVRPEVELSAEEQAAAEAARNAAREASGGRYTLEYGASTAALELINVPPVHELGLSGDGVIIGMLDTGFRTTHVALQDVDILDQYDFVHDDDIVEMEPGDADWTDHHGTHTLSTLMGFKNGELIGPAYGSSVILAATEDRGEEIPIEEDYWVAGLEWVESLGADIISTSLGYYYWYDYSDMDGNTAVTTVAGDMAVGRGLFVATSAGNERENPDFPHILAPADGDSIVATAAVNLNGQIANFSSPGPTYDGRIKPDLSALGVGNIAASVYDDNSYQVVNGTSFACPQIAGVAALMLERVPALTPMQIREAMRETASRAANPDNDYGWGLVDALAAIQYWGATIEHVQLIDTEDTTGPYTVTATITDRLPLDPGAMDLFWRVNGGDWQQAALVAAGGDAYSADIPGQAAGGFIEYYLRVTDNEGITINAPLAAPEQSFAFTVGADTTPPVVFHIPPIDQLPADWPPTLIADASDNLGIDRVELSFSLNGGPEQGPFVFAAVEDHYELSFPLASVQVGDELSYMLEAWDTASLPNSGTSGPHGIEIIDELGLVLVIDGSMGGAAGDSGERDTAADIGQWLLDAGYGVATTSSGDVAPGDFAGYDAVVLACGSAQAPLGFELMRTELRSWAADHGRILIEGGGITEAAVGDFQGGPYPEFAHEVLHVTQWWGDSYFEDVLLYPGLGLDQHPLLHRPYRVVSPVVVDLPEDSVIFGAFDYSYAAPDASAVLRASVNSNVGGVITHDDSTGPEAGQTVYFTFDVSKLDPVVGRELTENAMAYLLSREAPGNASISGRALYAQGGGAGGVTISCWPDRSVVTASDGTYTIDGLHGSTYTLTARLEGYGDAEQTVTLGADEALADLDFMLFPVVAAGGTATPEIPIPDNDPIGVSSIIHIDQSGAVYDLNIDVDISHYAIGNLVVTLTSPTGTEVTLHNRTGGNADDLIGNWPQTLIVDGPGALADFADEEAAGDWTLHVADLQGSAWGTLHSWGLNLLVVNDDLTAAPEQLPRATRLLGNSPNPFNPSTVIAFDLARAERVSLDVFDLSGRRMLRLVDGYREAGRHSVNWDGRDAAGHPVASGMYFYRLSAGAETDLRKMMLIK